MPLLTRLRAVLLAASLLIVFCVGQAWLLLSNGRANVEEWQVPPASVLRSMCDKAAGETDRAVRATPKRDSLVRAVAAEATLAQVQKRYEELRSRVSALEAERDRLLRGPPASPTPQVRDAPAPALAAGASERSAGAGGGAAMRALLRASTSEARLREVWRAERREAGSRAAMVEIHNDSWALLSPRELRRGVATLGDPQRLRCFAQKLLAGSSVRLSVVGGSVSFGTTFTTSKSKSLFHWKVYQWLSAVFPAASHEHFLGAVAASGPSYMEHCLHWHVLAPDLVLVEYAVNFDEFGMKEDAASFERMLRKLLRMPSQPAIIIVNTMELFPPDRSKARRRPP